MFGIPENTKIKFLTHAVSLRLYGSIVNVFIPTSLHFSVFVAWMRHNGMHGWSLSSRDITLIRDYVSNLEATNGEAVKQKRKGR